MGSHTPIVAGALDLDASDRTFLTRLIAAASEGADKPALVHRHKGRWVRRRWREVVVEVDRLAAGLVALGLRPGEGVAIGGDVTANLVLLSAAVLATGGRIVPLAGEAPAAEIRAAVATGGVAIAVTQSREGLARWLDATDGDRPFPVVLDHATPEARSPDERVIVFEALRGLAPARGWAETLPRSSRMADAAPAWAEEATGSSPILERLLDTWINGRETLAVPERHASALRDRAEIGPERWLASAAALDAAAAAVRTRLPSEGTLSARLLRPVLEGRRSPIGAVLRALVRQRLGLARIVDVDLLGGAADAETLALFGALGIGVREATPDVRPARAHGRTAEDLLLAPGYSL